MNVRNKLILIGLATTAVAFQPAAAQTAPAAAGFTAGAKVSDTAGAEVGTITNVDGDYVILKTDKHEVRLPKAWQASSISWAPAAFATSRTPAMSTVRPER